LKPALNPAAENSKVGLRKVGSRGVVEGRETKACIFEGDVGLIGSNTLPAGATVLSPV